MTPALLRMFADSSLRVTVVAILVAAILGALRVRTAAARHAAWTSVLCAMLLMPLLTYAVPAIAMPLPWPSSSPLPSVAAEQMAIAERTLLDFPSPRGGKAVRSIPPVAADRTRTAEGPRPRRWALAALAAYAVGMLSLAFRFGLGWLVATRIAREGAAVALPADGFPRAPARATIRETQAVSTPVTVGLWRPTILLPLEWRQWSGWKLRAVLAHEFAHIRRRDPAVSFIAHLNRCAFWFHPLAWWLVRMLAATAEEASDDQAVCDVGDGTRYAAILLDMATAVGRSGGRITSPGIGIHGGSVLARRIERVLRPDRRPETSLLHNGFLAASCAVAIAGVAACRPEPAPVLAVFNASVEQRDRQLRADLRAGFSRSPQPLADALVPVHERLVSYWNLYLLDAVGRGNQRITRRQVDPVRLASRRADILWLIEHHPESALTGSAEAQLVSADLEPFFPGDPLGYDQARALWLRQIERREAPAAVLGNASYFFEVSEPARAEGLLLRAHGLEPQGPWTARLGRLYANALAGNALRLPGSVRRLIAADPNGPYGVVVRRKLADATDDALLSAAGWYLEHAMQWPPLPFDANRWAETCFTRALQINPDAVLAHTELLKVKKRRESAGEPLWRVAPAEQVTYVSRLSEAERFERLPGLARGALGTLEELTRWDDPNLKDRIALAREQARRFSEDALTLAPRYRSHPGYGTAVYTANMTLGALALRDGDQRAAVAYLTKAARAPRTEDLAYAEEVVSGVHWHLAADLIERGERAAVLAFLERMSDVNITARSRLLAAAASLRRGERPRL